MDRTKRQALQLGVVGGAALLLGNQALAGTSRTAGPVIFDPTVTTLVNVLTCDPANQAALIGVLRESTDTVITTLDGWRSTSFVAAQDGTHVTIISQWRDAAAVRAMLGDERMKPHFTKVAALATVDSVMGSVAYARHA